MKRVYKLTAGFDINMTVSVDLEKLTPEMATEINGFWSGDEEVLAAAEGDVIEAAVRRAFPVLLRYLVDGWNGTGAVNRLEELEGWPGQGWGGIEVLDFELPEMDSEAIGVEVLA